MRAAAFAGLLLFGADGAAAADLTVTVQGIRNDRGQLHVTLFNSDKTWLDEKQVFQDQSIPPTPGNDVFVFHGLPPGRYAAVTFHDENANGKMDFDLIGLPTEGFAFSNQARPFLSAPNFKRCAFDIGSASAQISIKMIYP